MTEIWESGRILSVTADFFKKRGIESARLDAEILLADTLEQTREILLADQSRLLTELELTRYRERVRQRAAGKPAAYLLNRKEFYSLPFYVDEHVLIPRPETELLVDLALKLSRAAGCGRRVCDVGTGSGCIAAALAHADADLQITATEISKDAARVAVRNLSDLGLLYRVRVVECDLFPAPAGERYDIIVSNPPYVSMEEFESLSPTIRRYEPKPALTDGADGLTVYRRLVTECPAHLRSPGGSILLEVSPRISQRLPAILAEEKSPLALVDVHPDLAGLPRVAQLSWRST